LLWDGLGQWGYGWTGEGGLLWDGAGIFTPGFSGEGGLLWDGLGQWGYGWTGEGGLLWDGAGIFTPGFSGEGGLLWDGEGIFATGDFVDPGLIVMFGGAGSVPAGWLECDGSTYATAAYPALSAVLGTTWGSPGGGNFKVPDMRSRVPICTGTGSGLSGRTLASTGGVETVTLTTGQIPSHTHAQQANTYTGGAVVGLQGSLMPLNAAQGGTTGSAGTGGSHDNMTPFVAVRFVIKT
jgi:microcystin-dependent protein